MDEDKKNINKTQAIGISIEAYEDIKKLASVYGCSIKDMVDILASKEMQLQKEGIKQLERVRNSIMNKGIGQ